jgi:RNA polymerase sigma-70 factor, ECF subfamily
VHELDIPALTRRMVEGDDMAYRQFHDAYCNRLWRYLIVVSAGNEETARDALQQTFTRVVRHIRIFPSEEIFWSWLTVIARHVLFDTRRSQRRYFAFLDRFTQHRAAEHEPPAAHAAGDRLEELLQRELALLPAEDRDLIERKYFERQSVAAIASARQTTASAVESRLVRIRHKLKTAVLAALRDDSQP